MKINWGAAGVVVAGIALTLSLLGGLKSWYLMPHQIDQLQRQTNNLTLSIGKERKEIRSELKSLRSLLDVSDRVSVIEERVNKHDDRLDDTSFGDWWSFRSETETKIELMERDLQLLKARRPNVR